MCIEVLFSRASGLLRGITSRLGAPARLRLIVNAKHAVTGLAMERRGEPGKTGS